MQDYSQSYAFVSALAGDPETSIMDFRAIHDVRKDIPAIPMRGTLPSTWSSIQHYQAQGYGIFVCVNQMDGATDENGKLKNELANVQSIRAHVIDLDNTSAPQNYQRAVNWQLAPSFAVNTSPNKYHVYWPVTPYQGNDRYSMVQRKLRQFFDGDKSVIDATRVLRLPGSLHLKNPETPHMVTCWSLNGYGNRYTPETLEAALGDVNVIDGSGTRHDLGEPSLAAPSMEWIETGLRNCDPNELDRYEWIALMAAFKQSVSTLIDEQSAFNMFSEWCARYENNDPAENLKHWNSIRNTELGWKSFMNRIPALKGAYAFERSREQAATPLIDATNDDVQPVPASPFPAAPLTPPSAGDMTPEPVITKAQEWLTAEEQKVWFKDCYYVIDMGKMLTPDMRFLNTGQFNAQFGGKYFIIDGNGKTTDEAWKAATRSTINTVPKVDHTRFLPDKNFMETVHDELGREGINTYKPIIQRRVTGDVMPYINHLRLIMPQESDRVIFHDFMAHNIKYPGFKIPWSPLIQSVQGIGKNVFKLIAYNAIGRIYTHEPEAQQLAEGGSKFNGWLRNKLFIICDEIRVGDKLDMIETLKPFISEERKEIQSKGIDQEMFDNWANWLFFSNFKDAIPVDQNERRWSVFYSAIQHVNDLRNAGMDGAYFRGLYDWLKGDGAAIVTDYYMEYPIQRGDIPMRAPDTTSTAEALELSLSPLERMVLNAVEDGLAGFKGGWVSSIMLQKQAEKRKMKHIRETTMKTVLGKMGYKDMGRAPIAYFQEDAENRTRLFNLHSAADVNAYGHIQGYGT